MIPCPPIHRYQSSSQTFKRDHLHVTHNSYGYFAHLPMPGSELRQTSFWWLPLFPTSSISHVNARKGRVPPQLWHPDGSAEWWFAISCEHGSCHREVHRHAGAEEWKGRATVNVIISHLPFVILKENDHNLQVCFLPQDEGRFRQLLPQSEFDSVTEMLDSLDEKSIKAMEFIALFGSSSTPGNLGWALR